ncbi:MAG: sensor histidine kinase [Actinomycetota bacterium]
MSSAITILQDALLAGFCAVTAVAAIQFAQRPGRQRGFLAAALALTTLNSALSLIGRETDYRYRIVHAAGIVAFLGSAYMLLLFRHSFVRVSRAGRIVAGAALVAAGIIAIASRLPYSAKPHYTNATFAVLTLMVATWCEVVIEPIARFWSASADRPRVQRLRLRALSVGFSLLLLTRLAIVLARIGSSQVASLTEDAIALLLVPAFYVSLLPPGWLRRAWSRQEAEELALTRRLVAFAPDRGVLASRALGWATRLVGADAGFLLDTNGCALATLGIDEQSAESYGAYADADHARLFHFGSDQLAIAVPIEQEHGRGLLVAVSGPFTVLFGSDEMAMLEQHADLIGFALDRVSLTETRDKLEQTKTQFLANAAHELRTPLAAIVGFSELFAQGIDKMDPKNVQEGLAAIVRQGRRMATLVSDLLDFTRLELGKARMSMEPIVLAPAVEQSIANSTPPGGRVVGVDVPPDAMVLADPVRLDQVLTNLLVNAFRYGGPNVTIGARNTDGAVHIVVEDDGQGVPDDVQQQLFEPFTRARNARTEDGSGLGLAIVRSLVEAFGGRVSYEPAEPQGARFIVQLRPAE